MLLPSLTLLTDLLSVLLDFPCSLALLARPLMPSKGICPACPRNKPSKHEGGAYATYCLAEAVAVAVGLHRALRALRVEAADPSGSGAVATRGEAEEAAEPRAGRGGTRRDIVDVGAFPFGKYTYSTYLVPYFTVL